MLSIFWVAVLLAAISANANDIVPSPDDKDPDSVASWLMEVEAIVRTRTDPVRRTIICRVPFTDISITALVQSTNIPRPNIMRAITRLETMGLVKVSNDAAGHFLIIPASEEARDKMRRWASDWCISEDECKSKY